MRNTWEYHSSSRIIFGCGAIHNLASVMHSLDAANLLLITDPGIKRAGIVDRVVHLLEQQGLHVILFDKAVPEPAVQTALDCYEVTRLHKKIDAVVGLGGGSSIDLAKIVAVLLKYGGAPLDYAGENKVPGPILPLVAIPTTAGTGSEVTSISVITDSDNHLKVGISDHHLRPLVALLDPELTIGLPPYVTACTGMDALSHAVEAYTAKDYKYIQAQGSLMSQGSFPLTDTLALDAIRLIANHLITAVQQGSNLEARSGMMLGSLMAGMAFSNAGVALAHALAYPIGGLTASPHGELTGLLLPHVTRYNAAVSKYKLRRIAEALLLPVDRLKNNEVESAVFHALTELLVRAGLPVSLSAIGITREAVPGIAEKSLLIDRLIRGNPRVPNQTELEGLLYNAL